MSNFTKLHLTHEILRTLHVLNSYHSSANQSSDNRKIIGRSTSSVKTAAVCSAVSGNAEVRKTAEAFKCYAKTKQPDYSMP